MRDDALAIRDELDSESIKAGKIGLRLCDYLYLLSSFKFGEQRSAGDCNFDNRGVWPVSPVVLFLVGAGVFREYLRRDLYFGLFFVGCLPDPVLKAVVALIA